MPNYDSLVTKQVKKAFDLVGTLAIDVTLTNSSSETYTFPKLDADGELESGGEIAGTSLQTIVKAVISESNKELQGGEKEVLIQTADIDDPSVYDVILIGTKEHTIVSSKIVFGLTVITVTEV